MERYVGIQPDGRPVIVVNAFGFRRDVRRRWRVPEDYLGLIGNNCFPSLEIMETWPTGWTTESMAEYQLWEMRLAGFITDYKITGIDGDQVSVDIVLPLKADFIEIKFAEA